MSAAPAAIHCRVKAVSRSDGRSATAAIAYRAGELIRDQRTGEVHDYRPRKGVAHTEIVLPAGAPTWAQDRAALWNAAEVAETYKNAKVGREWEIDLPHEIGDATRVEMTRTYARWLSERYGIAVDVAIHRPSPRGDQRNHHAHLLGSTRVLGADGFGAKTRILDVPKTSGAEVDACRKRWAEICNAALELAGVDRRVDHRSFERQGRDEEPTVHLGPELTAFERATGDRTLRGQRNDQAADRNHARAWLQAELHQVEAEIVSLEAERARRQAARAAELAAAARAEVARREAEAQARQEAERRAKAQAQREAKERAQRQSEPAPRVQTPAPKPQAISIDLRPLPDQLRKQSYDLQGQSGSHRHTANMLDVPELLTEHDAGRQLTADETRAVEIANSKWRQIQQANAAADNDRGFFGRLMASRERGQERQALEQAARERQEAQERLQARQQWLDTAEGCKAVWGAQEARQRLRFGRQQARLDAAAEADRLRAQADRMAALSRDVGALVRAGVTSLTVKQGHTTADLEAAVKARLEAPDVKERLAQQQRQTRSQGPRIR